MEITIRGESDVFIKYLEKIEEDCKEFLENSNALTSPSGNLERKHTRCWITLGVILRLRGDVEKSKKVLEPLSKTGIATANHRFDFEGFKEEFKDDKKLLIDMGEGQLKRSIYLALAGVKPGKAEELLEWAAENSEMSDHYVEWNSDVGQHDRVAKGFLWHGYALLMLGKYGEACEDLSKVRPYLEEYKKSGVEMWRRLEHYLPKALLPLCRYLKEPSEEKRVEAQKGLEEYIDSFQDYEERLDGYLYYLHLRESFPEVYGEESSIELNGPLESDVNDNIRVSGEAESGEGILFLVSREGPDPFVELGTHDEFREFVEKAGEPGNYPAVTALWEDYISNRDISPSVLRRDVEQLLEEKGLEPDVRGIAESVLEGAEWGEAEDRNLIILSEKEMPQ